MSLVMFHKAMERIHAAEYPPVEKDEPRKKRVVTSTSDTEQDEPREKKHPTYEQVREVFRYCRDYKEPVSLYTGPDGVQETYVDPFWQFDISWPLLSPELQQSELPELLRGAMRLMSAAKDHYACFGRPQDEKDSLNSMNQKLRDKSVLLRELEMIRCGNTDELAQLYVTMHNLCETMENQGKLKLEPYTATVWMTQLLLSFKLPRPNSNNITYQIMHRAKDMAGFTIYLENEVFALPPSMQDWNDRDDPDKYIA